MDTPDDPRWEAVDDLFATVLGANDPALDQTLRSVVAEGLPAISVSVVQGKLLHLLVRAVGARKVLEVGTLGGYSAIWMARALPPGGTLITCELDPHHAEVAQANFARAAVADRIELRLGPAADSLDALEKEHAGPFDFVFIDADKPAYPEYLQRALRLSRPGTVIVADNVVRGGRVLEAASDDPAVVGTRTTLEQMGAEPLLEATAVQTVGQKGYDGFAFAVVTGAPSA